MATPSAMTSMFIIVSRLYFSTLNTHPTVYTTHGMSALTIWMKATLRYTYAELPIHSTTAKSPAMGTIFCTYVSRLMLIPFTTPRTRTRTNASAEQKAM